jgi:hypothetical protein
LKFDPINYNLQSLNYCITLKLSQISKQSSIKIAISSNLCSPFLILQSKRKNETGTRKGTARQGGLEAGRPAPSAPVAPPAPLGAWPLPDCRCSAAPPECSPMPRRRRCLLPADLPVSRRRPPQRDAAPSSRTPGVPVSCGPVRHLRSPLSRSPATGPAAGCATPLGLADALTVLCCLQTAGVGGRMGQRGCGSLGPGKFGPDPSKWQFEAGME